MKDGKQREKCAIEQTINHSSTTYIFVRLCVCAYVCVCVCACVCVCGLEHTSVNRASRLISMKSRESQRASKSTNGQELVYWPVT